MNQAALDDLHSLWLWSIAPSLLDTHTPWKHITILLCDSVQAILSRAWNPLRVIDSCVLFRQNTIDLASWNREVITSLCRQTETYTFYL